MTQLFPFKPVLLAMLKNKTGPLLVALQIALSLAILSNAVYLVNQRLSSSERSSGIGHEEQVFSLFVKNQKSGGHEEQLAAQKREEQVMKSVPGLVSLARVNSIPMSQSGWNRSIAADRKQISPSGNAAIYISAGSLVKVWELQLLEGRDFTPEEFLEIDQSTARNSPDVAIISKAMARALFPDASSYAGREFYFGTGDGAESVRIVGVVDTLQTAGAQDGVRGEMSVMQPARMTNDAYSGYTLRAAADKREQVMQDVEKALRAASPEPLNIRMQAQTNIREDRYRNDKGLSWMLLTVCGLLIMITASGIVGMCSLWVTQRTKQVGIRRALGATRLHILMHFLTENLLISVSGIVLGCVLALGLNQLLVTQFDMRKLPLTYLLWSPLLFCLLGMVAALAPAWRAARIAPATATRSV